MTCNTRQIFVVLVVVLTFSLIILSQYTQKLTVYSDYFNDLLGYNSNNETSGDSLEKFKRIHRDIIYGRAPVVRVTFSRVENVGYGNKLYTLLSALTIAILSDSAMLAEWPQVDKYVEEPLDAFFTSFSGPTDLNTNHSPSTVYHPSARQPWSKRKDLRQLTKTFLPLDERRFRFDSYNAYFVELCSNPVYYSKLQHYGLVSKATVEGALTSLYDPRRSYAEDERVDSVLQIGFEVGGNLLNRLWVPKRILRDRIEHYWTSGLKGYYVIGIQIREYYLSALDRPLFVDCAHDIEKSVTTAMGNETFASKYKGFKWFVTSDSPSALKDMAEAHGNKTVVASEPMGHIAANAKAYPRAIIDVELLSRCHKIIITGGSTYGFLAAMKSLQHPYYVNGRVNMSRCRLHKHSRPSTTDLNDATFKR